MTRFTYSFIAADLPASYDSYVGVQALTFDSLLRFVVARCHLRFNFDRTCDFVNLAPSGNNYEIRSRIGGIMRVEIGNTGHQSLTQELTQVNSPIKYALRVRKRDEADDCYPGTRIPLCPLIVLQR